MNFFEPACQEPTRCESEFGLCDDQDGTKAYTNITVYKYKKAFACNKKHPHFKEIDNEQNLHFFRKYGVRIDLQARIIFI